MTHPFQTTGVAAELFSAAWCNLDCRYCYIPKHNTVISKKHKEIIKKVKEVYPLIDVLKELYGDKLQILSHWGSEPTLTIKYFKPFYKAAIQEFPELDSISMSSNFLGPVDDLLDFIKVLPTERQFKISVQVSLDGPEYITDVNRGQEGATQKIVKNYCYFIEELNKIKLHHKVSTHFKPTMASDEYEDMIYSDGLERYYSFFEEVTNKIKKANFNKQVSISFNCDPTIVCPGNYTAMDGKLFNKLYEKTLTLGDKYTVPVNSGYYMAFVRVVAFGDEFFTKQKMFTCSAGDSQFGVDDYINPCHDTFYINLPGYEDALREDTDRLCSAMEEQNVQRESYKKIKKIISIPVTASDEEKLKYIYLMRSYHDFTKNKLSISIGIIKELADCGQISKCYKHYEMAKILAIFTMSRHSCPTGNAQNSGFMSANPIGYYKLFGNGLVENFIKRYLKEKDAIE